MPSTNNLKWYVFYISTKDGKLKQTHYTNPQPGGKFTLQSKIITKYDFMIKFLSTKPTAASICKEICKDDTIPISEISPLACENELENQNITRQFMKRYISNQKRLGISANCNVRELFYHFYSSKFNNYTLVMHPVGRHYDVFADKCASLENRVCFKIDGLRTKLPVLPYGRGGCGLGNFCFAILDWETAHKQRRRVWTADENQHLIYSAQWYASQGEIDKRFDKTVRKAFFGNNPQLGITEEED